MNDNNKIFKVIGIVIVVLLGILIITSFVDAKTKTKLKKLGATVENFPSHFINGLYGGISDQWQITKNGEETINGVTVGVQKISISAGAVQNYWKNTTGSTVWIDKAEMGYATGKASTTFAMALIATTTSTIPDGYDLTTILPTASTTVLGGTTYATSTLATTTNNIANPSPSGFTKVLNNQSVILFLYQTFQNNCTGSVCEKASSTNRGFNPYAEIFYHR